MERQTIESDGRKYEVYADGSGMNVTIGPPEGLVDSLELPKPIATRLHNALHRRGILTAKDAATKHKQLLGALQEALGVDAQRLMQAYNESQ